jgi:threonine-phosphate decarboxylase
MINGHGGNVYQLARDLGCLPSDIIDMSSNVNPFGPPPGLMALLKENIHAITALPEVDAGSAVGAFSARYGLRPDQVVPGNGTTQLIHTLPLALETRHALIVAPTYSDYADSALNLVWQSFPMPPTGPTRYFYAIPTTPPPT